jgi:hypothetical protein
LLHAVEKPARHQYADRSRVRETIVNSILSDRLTKDARATDYSLRIVA